MDKMLARLSWFFLLAGLAMIGAAVYWIGDTHSFIERSAAVSGTVIDLERSRSGDSTSYFPVVKFKTRSGQERTFRSSSGSNPPGYDVGDTVEVLYDEHQPSDARIRGFFSLWGGPAIVGGIGGLLTLIGGGLMYARRRRRAGEKELRRRGLPVQTDFQSVEMNTLIRVGSRSPWRIVTQWKNPATGELHLFYSQNLWFDPTAHIHTKQITVYVDRRNAKRHYMDVSFLPKLAA